MVDWYLLHEKALANCIDETLAEDIAIVWHSDQSISTTYRELGAKIAVIEEEIKPLLAPGKRVALLLKQDSSSIPLILALMKCSVPFLPVSPDDHLDDVFSRLIKFSITNIIFSSNTVKYGDLFASYTSSNAKSKASRLELRSLPSIGDETHLIRIIVENDKSEQSIPTVFDDSGGSESEKSIAYLITTSGTTGKPTMVMVPHCCIVPNVKDFGELFNIKQGDVIFQASPLTFDASIVQIFMALAFGATLLCVPDSMRLKTRLLGKLLFCVYKVTILQVSPSFFQLLMSADEGNYLGQSAVRVLAFGGEPFPNVSSILQWTKNLDNLEIFNLYGTTEMSSWASAHRVNYTNLEQRSRELTELLAKLCHKDKSEHPEFLPCPVPLGNSLSDTTITVLGDNDEAITRGVGEVWIGSKKRICLLSNGFGLSRYEQQPTGDVAVILNGEIYYVGRKDNQVKRFGRRINLESLEQCVQLTANIALALFCQSTQRHHANDMLSQKKLLLCVTTKNKCRKVDIDQIRKVLPSYGQPDFILEFPYMPLTRHGKVDRWLLSRLMDKIFSASAKLESLHGYFFFDLDGYITSRLKKRHVKPPTIDLTSSSDEEVSAAGLGDETASDATEVILGQSPNRTFCKGRQKSSGHVKGSVQTSTRRKHGSPSAPVCKVVDFYDITQDTMDTCFDSTCVGNSHLDGEKESVSFLHSRPVVMSNASNGNSTRKTDFTKIPVGSRQQEDALKDYRSLQSCLNDSHASSVHVDYQKQEGNRNDLYGTDVGQQEVAANPPNNSIDIQFSVRGTDTRIADPSNQHLSTACHSSNSERINNSQQNVSLPISTQPFCSGSFDAIFPDWSYLTSSLHNDQRVNTCVMSNDPKSKTVVSYTTPDSSCRIVQTVASCSPNTATAGSSAPTNNARIVAAASSRDTVAVTKQMKLVAPTNMTTSITSTRSMSSAFSAISTDLDFTANHTISVLLTTQPSQMVPTKCARVLVTTTSGSVISRPTSKCTVASFCCTSSVVVNHTSPVALFNSVSPILPSTYTPLGGARSSLSPLSPPNCTTLVTSVSNINPLAPTTRLEQVVPINFTTPWGPSYNTTAVDTTNHQNAAAPSTTSPTAVSTTYIHLNPRCKSMSLVAPTLGSTATAPMRSSNAVAPTLSSTAVAPSSSASPITSSIVVLGTSDLEQVLAALIDTDNIGGPANTPVSNLVPVTSLQVIPLTTFDAQVVTLCTSAGFSANIRDNVDLSRETSVSFNQNYPSATSSNTLSLTVSESSLGITTVAGDVNTSVNSIYQVAVTSSSPTISSLSANDAIDLEVNRQPEADQLKAFTRETAVMEDPGGSSIEGISLHIYTSCCEQKALQDTTSPWRNSYPLPLERFGDDCNILSRTGNKCRLLKKRRIFASRSRGRRCKFAVRDLRESKYLCGCISTERVLASFVDHTARALMFRPRNDQVRTIVNTSLRSENDTVQNHNQGRALTLILRGNIDLKPGELEGFCNAPWKRSRYAKSGLQDIFSQDVSAESSQSGGTSSLRHTVSPDVIPTESVEKKVDLEDLKKDLNPPLGTSCEYQLFKFCLKKDPFKSERNCLVLQKLCTGGEKPISGVQQPEYVDDYGSTNPRTLTKLSPTTRSPAMSQWPQSSDQEPLKPNRCNIKSMNHPITVSYKSSSTEVSFDSAQCLRGPVHIIEVTDPTELKLNSVKSGLLALPCKDGKLILHLPMPMALSDKDEPGIKYILPANTPFTCSSQECLLCQKRKPTFRLHSLPIPEGTTVRNRLGENFHIWCLYKDSVLKEEYGCLRANLSFLWLATFKSVLPMDYGIEQSSFVASGGSSLKACYLAEEVERFSQKIKGLYVTLVHLLDIILNDNFTALWMYMVTQSLKCTKCLSVECSSVGLSYGIPDCKSLYTNVSTSHFRVSGSNVPVEEKSLENMKEVARRSLQKSLQNQTISRVPGNESNSRFSVTSKLHDLIDSLFSRDDDCVLEYLTDGCHEKDKHRSKSANESRPECLLMVKKGEAKTYLSSKREEKRGECSASEGVFFPARKRRHDANREGRMQSFEQHSQCDKKRKIVNEVESAGNFLKTCLYPSVQSNSITASVEDRGQEKSLVSEASEVRKPKDCGAEKVKAMKSFPSKENNAQNGISKQPGTHHDAKDKEKNVSGTGSETTSSDVQCQVKSVDQKINNSSSIGHENTSSPYAQSTECVKPKYRNLFESRRSLLAEIDGLLKRCRGPSPVTSRSGVPDRRLTSVGRGLSPDEINAEMAESKTLLKGNGPGSTSGIRGSVGISKRCMKTSTVSARVAAAETVDVLGIKQILDSIIVSVVEAKSKHSSSAEVISIVNPKTKLLYGPKMLTVGAMSSESVVSYGEEESQPYPDLVDSVPEDVRNVVNCLLVKVVSAVQSGIVTISSNDADASCAAPEIRRHLKVTSEEATNENVEEGTKNNDDALDFGGRCSGSSIAGSDNYRCKESHLGIDQTNTRLEASLRNHRTCTAVLDTEPAYPDDSMDAIAPNIGKTGRDASFIVNGSQGPTHNDEVQPLSKHDSSTTEVYGKDRIKDSKGVDVIFSGATALKDTKEHWKDQTKDNNGSDDNILWVTTLRDSNEHGKDKAKDAMGSNDSIWEVIAITDTEEHRNQSKDYQGSQDSVLRAITLEDTAAKAIPGTSVAAEIAEIAKEDFAEISHSNDIERRETITHGIVAGEGVRVDIPASVPLTPTKDLAERGSVESAFFSNEEYRCSVDKQGGHVHTSSGTETNCDKDERESHKTCVNGEETVKGSLRKRGMDALELLDGSSQDLKPLSVFRPFADKQGQLKLISTDENVLADLATGESLDPDQNFRSLLETVRQRVSSVAEKLRSDLGTFITGRTSANSVTDSELFTALPVTSDSFVARSKQNDDCLPDVATLAVQPEVIASADRTGDLSSDHDKLQADPVARSSKPKGILGEPLNVIGNIKRLSSKLTKASLLARLSQTKPVSLAGTTVIGLSNKIDDNGNLTGATEKEHPSLVAVAFSEAESTRKRKVRFMEDVDDDEIPETTAGQSKRSKIVSDDLLSDSIEDSVRNKDKTAALGSHLNVTAGLGVAQRMANLRQQLTALSKALTMRTPRRSSQSDPCSAESEVDGSKWKSVGSKPCLVAIHDIFGGEINAYQKEAFVRNFRPHKVRLHDIFSCECNINRDLHASLRERLKTDCAVANSMVPDGQLSGMRDASPCDKHSTQVPFAKVPSVRQQRSMACWCSCNRGSRLVRCAQCVMLGRNCSRLSSPVLMSSSPARSVKIEVVWQTNLKRCVDASPLCVCDGHSSQSTGTIFIGSHGHVVASVDARRGSVNWETSLPDRVESSAALSWDGKSIIVGCYDGFVYVLDRLTGKELWSYKTIDTVKSSPLVDQITGLAYTGSHDGHAYALDIARRRLVWSQFCGGGPCFASPRLSFELDQVYFASLSGQCLALCPRKGEIKWLYRCGKPIFASPCVTAEGVVFTSVDGTVHMLNSIGELKWTFKMDGHAFSTPTLISESRTPKHVIIDLACDNYAPSDDSSFDISIELSDVVDYKENVSSSICQSLLTDLIVLGCHDSNVYVIDSNGKLVLKFACDSPVYGSPCFVPVQVDRKSIPHLFIASTKGTLYFVDLAEGELRASLKLEGEIFSSPVLFGRRLYVGCRDDHLYCLKLATSSISNAIAR